MTQEEILNMKAGREMDELIARFIYPDAIRFFAYSNYSTNMEDSWDVVNKFPFVSLTFDSATWSCLFSDGENEFSAGSDLSNPSPMLAICRAALLSTVNK